MQMATIGWSFQRQSRMATVRVYDAQVFASVSRASDVKDKHPVLPLLIELLFCYFPNKSK